MFRRQETYSSYVSFFNDTEKIFWLRQNDFTTNNTLKNQKTHRNHKQLQEIRRTQIKMHHVQPKLHKANRQKHKEHNSE